MTTLFTKIIDGAIPGRFVWADDLVVAFLTIEPITDGHTLVVPRAEIEQLTDAPDDLLAHLISVTKTIGLAQRAAWGAPRAAVLVAGFEIPHLHVHVLPAWDEASLTFANARHGVPGAEPGRVLAASRDGIDIACAEGALRLLAVQRAGGRRIGVADYLNARPELKQAAS